MSPAGSHQLFNTNTMTGATPTDPMIGPAPADQDSASESRFRLVRAPAFSVPKDFKQGVVKLDNIDPLIGQSNYEDWSDQMHMVFRAMGTQSIVIEGAQPSQYALSAEREAYTTMSQSAFLVLIQVLSKLILKKVAKYQTPHEIWSYLKQTYHVDNAFSFIHQMHALFGLSQTFNTTESISDFLDRFET